MQHLTLTAIAAAALATVATAQTTFRGGAPRPEVQLSTGLITTSNFSFNSWHVAAPKQALPANAQAGLADTRSVVYGTWNDINRNRNNNILVARSVDGGWSWPVGAVEAWEANTAAGETFENPEVRLETVGNVVGFVITADRDPSGQPDAQQRDYCWLVASNDQGQTWQRLNMTSGITAPLSTGDQLFDVDEPWVTLTADGVFHVVFEADYQIAVGRGNVASGNENIFYRRARFNASGNLVAVDAEERKIESTPSGTIDTDSVRIAGAVSAANDDPSRIVICWRDNREDLVVNGTYGNLSVWNETWFTWSTDGGNTFATEIRNGSFQAAGGSAAFDPRIPKCAISPDGQTIVVTSEDSRPFGGSTLDRIYGSISLNGGQTWAVQGAVISNEPNDPNTNLPVDIDGHNPAFVGNTFILTYLHDFGDNGAGIGNIDNDLYAVVDPTKGAQLAAGNVPAEKIILNSPTQCSEIGNIDGFSNAQAGITGAGVDPNAPALIVANCETSNFPEDNGYAYSTDGGNTWFWYEALQFQSGDTDDPHVACTLNGDIVCLWQDDDNGGNGNNNIYVRGNKVMGANVSGARNEVLNAFDIPAAYRNTGFVLFIPSLLPPASQAGPLAINGTTVVLNFNVDVGLALAALQAGLFVPVIGQESVSLNPVINFATLLGQTFYWEALLLDGSGLTRFYSDPFVQNP